MFARVARSSVQSQPSARQRPAGALIFILKSSSGEHATADRGEMGSKVRTEVFPGGLGRCRTIPLVAAARSNRFMQLVDGQVPKLAA